MVKHDSSSILYSIKIKGNFSGGFYEKTTTRIVRIEPSLGNRCLRNRRRQGTLEGEETATFQATIVEIQDGYFLVKPVEASSERNSADQITVPMTNMDPSPEPEVGDILEIEYDGSIAESYPAQITNVYHIRVVKP